MMIVLITISILLFVIAVYLNEKEMGVTCFVAGSIKCMIIIWLTIEVINLRVIDKKIKLYQTQNKEIETKIELVVKQYMEYEHQTFKDLTKSDSYITLITLYPELKSDELIKEEIKLYEKNNQTIISLKENKIHGKIYKWWLYFGE